MKAADEAEPSLEEKTIPSSITNVPDEVLGGMSQSFDFSSSYRDLEWTELSLYDLD